MTTSASSLDVALHGELIGTLTYLGGDRSIFTFAQSYIDNPARATLSLGFKDTFGNLITDFRTYQTQLMPFFSNLLPEGHLRTYLADKLELNPAREFQLIAALGHDLPGAITVTPAGDRAATHHPANAFVEHPESALEPDELLRFSLAGVQLKFSAIRSPKGGLTIPAHGVGGDWIVKLPSLQFDAIPANEFSMMQLAKLIGMDVPAIDMVPLTSIANFPRNLARHETHAFIIERFDRGSDQSKIHIEDFAQVYGVYPDKKYGQAKLSNIARVLLAECDYADLQEFMRRMVFNILIGNGDMHLKNWSLIYPDRNKPKLAPAYDFVSTVPYLDGETMALNVSRTKRFTEIDTDEIKHLIKKSGAPGAMLINTVKETVALFYETWHANKANLPMSKRVREAIETHLKTLPLARMA